MWLRANFVLSLALPFSRSIFAVSMHQSRSICDFVICAPRFSVQSIETKSKTIPEFFIHSIASEWKSPVSCAQRMLLPSFSMTNIIGSSAATWRAEGSDLIAKDVDCLVVFKRVDLGESPRLRVARARGKIRLVLFNGGADTLSRLLAEIEIDGFFHTAHAAEKIAGEEVIVMVVCDEHVLHLSHIKPRECTMMKGIDREIDGKATVKQSH